jgi:hypothetical protein
MFIVELEPKVWLAEGIGDPCRTLRREFARQFSSELLAAQAITRARQYRPSQNIAPS